MDRRAFIAGLSGTGALAAGGALLPGCALGAAGDQINVVEAFGFVGDGRTDNYAAFQLLAAHANRNRGGNYLFPPGTYYVHRYRDAASHRREPGAVVNGEYEHCDGLTFSGHGAKIVLNGRFHRGQGDSKYNAMYMPFTFGFCRNIRIAGFEMDGGVRQATRDVSTWESFSHLISLSGCTNVVLEDLNLHHSLTDGLLLYFARPGPGRVALACRNVVMNRVACRYNARGGFAPLQVHGLVCTDCDFSYNGFDLGKYVAHAPGFGVDVEPDAIKPDIDILTGNLEFRRCKFNENVSAFLACYPRRYEGYLRIIDCSSTNRRRAQNHMLLAWPGALIEGGVHDSGDGAIYLSWQGDAGDTGGDITLRSTEIRSSAGYGLFHPHDGHLVTLDRVKIVGTHTGAAEAGWVLAFHGDPGGGRKNRITGCDVFIPAARKFGTAPYDFEVTLRHTISQNNHFRTNLRTGGGAYFVTEYGPGAVSRGDRFSPADSFRPG
ncbi:MAG TPA: hypothetical protein VF759_04880 [Allosphingosinicella sp.]|jgi:hypothetical protein